MKKRYLLQAVLIGCMIFAGCGTSEKEAVASVEEIPIEINTEVVESAESVENTESEDVIAAMDQESTAFEDIEIEVKGDKGTILVGTTGTPYTELLTQAKLQLAEEGWDLQIKYYDDYAKLNEDVLNSVLDAHLFAHQTYMDSYNDVNKTELVSIAPVCYETYGIYSKLNGDLTKVSGATIALPQEAEKIARALLFMQEIGWITLKGDRGMTTIMEDIEENSMDIQFAEYTSDSLADALDNNDYCIIGADTAIVSGFSVEDDAIRTETKDSISAGIYATILVTTQEKAEDAGLQLLADALVSDITAEYVSDTYKGAIELFN